MKKHNRIIAGIMAVCLMGVVGIIPESIAPAVSVTASAEIIRSGTCGENVTYTLDDEGTLTISGTGDMTDFRHKNELWSKTFIEQVIIKDGITNIGDSAFSNYKNLTSVKIPDSVTSIGYSSFAQCSSLTSITIPNSVISFDDFAFNSSGLTSIEIPDSVTSIGYNVFAGCSNLVSITIPDNIKSIEAGTFFACTNLNKIIILNPECEIFDNASTISNVVHSPSSSSFDGTIYGYNDSTAQAYAEKYDYKFESLGKAPEKETISGDLNGDNEFNVSDVVTFQQYILGGSDKEISDWKQADLNSDGVLDVFDLCLMKKKLIEK